MITEKRRRISARDELPDWGLGSIAAPVYEDCNPTDSACVARNNTLNAAWNLAVLSETRQKQLAFLLERSGVLPSTVSCAI